MMQDNDGYIRLDEMEYLVHELDLERAFPPPLLRKVFTDADADGDGQITFEGLCGR
jgi:Ca2+-binding EF-hand superfamily protein